jgi:hypothetical protein
VKAAVCKQVKIQTVVLWLTQYSLVGKYQHFRGKHCPYHPARQHMKAQCNKNAHFSSVTKCNPPSADAQTLQRDPLYMYKQVAYQLKHLPEFHYTFRRSEKKSGLKHNMNTSGIFCITYV